jgi:hypothetical protein
MTDQADTLHVQDIDHFIALLFAWHKNRVKTLEHMLTVPEGTEVTFNDEGPQILTGDMLKGFVIGLSLGLMELGTLPFAAEMDTTPASPDEPVH